MRIVNIPKGNGKFRTIYMPSDKERMWIDPYIYLMTLYSEKVDTMNVAHAFRKGRSILTNAEPHIGFQYTLSMDFKDFFDSVTPEIYLRGTYEGDNAYANPFLFPDGAARQGLSTSPAIANIAAAPFDRDVCQLGEGTGRFGKHFVYTRYADDLTFSFDMFQVGKMLEKRIPELARQHGFTINESKTKWQCAKAGRRIITGVAVGEKDIQPPRYLKRRKRAIEHSLAHGFSQKSAKKLVGQWAETHRDWQEKMPSIRSMAHRQLRGLIEFMRLKKPKHNTTQQQQPSTTTPRVGVIQRVVNTTTNVAASILRGFGRTFMKDE